MRAKGWLLLLVIVTASCQLEPAVYVEVDFEALTEIVLQVSDQIDYVSDAVTYYPYSDYWQTCDETDALGTGDCEDFVIYAMRRIKDELGVETEMALGHRVSFVGASPHAWLTYEGRSWEATGGYEVTGNESYVLQGTRDYDWVMNRAAAGELR